MKTDDNSYACAKSMDQGFLKVTDLYLGPIISTHLIYEEESLFVCLFFMHSVPVRARAAKLCMASLGPGEGQDGVGATEGGVWNPTEFSKNRRIISDF
jgi:hypothetical protein